MRDRLLFTLKGHLSAITDLRYSSKGDRILSASQEGGVVRIWSWSNDPASMTDAPTDPDEAFSKKISHILIKLTRPGEATSGRGANTVANRASKADVRCDGATWITDDSKIVTSQSESSKQKPTEIVANSQYLFLWDSDSGQCLLGIPGAHTQQCSVLLPHPKLPLVICSAGADGIVKLWDFESGKCVFDHVNKAEFGPLDPKERGNTVAYLDGDFSPDGTSLVLTDESGRVSVFDSRHPLNNKGSSSSNSFPAWMREQYFSNDYYDLFYDTNGYCVEKNSTKPPHLAPRGSRCSHSGLAVSPQINDAFNGLTGPIPLCERACRWKRLQLIERLGLARRRKGASRGNLVQQYDPESTVLLHVGTITDESRTKKQSKPCTQQAARQAATASPARNRVLSSNYRWSDYSDMPVDDNDDGDRDDGDEEFQLNDNRRSGARVEGEVNDSDSENLDDDMMDEEFEEPDRRSSARQPRRSSTGQDQDDSDQEFVEYMSTNNTPSGPFVGDYNNHFFRMPTARQADSLNRLWCRRLESSRSYSGRKSYSPQVGDSVVYIPRAHYETVVQVPLVPPPWQNWPGEVSWPVVKCCIRNVRYRFPFTQYKNLFR